MKEQQFHSCLEFGAVDLENQQKRVWDYKTGQNAYDWFMCARYLNDLLAYVQMTKLLDGNKTNLQMCLNLFLEKVHHIDDLALNLDKWIALKCRINEQEGNSAVTFYELGSTLFGCIEGIDFVNSFIKSCSLPPLSADQVNWIGVDNSIYLNSAALQLHQNHNVTLYEHFADVKEDIEVFFAKGVSLLYALDKASDFKKVLASTKLALFDYSFANRKSFVTTIGTGKMVNYITKEAFIADLPSDKVCYKRTDKIQDNGDTSYYELLIGEQLAVDAFIEQQREVFSTLATCISDEQQQLFFRNSLKNINWQPL